MNSLKILVLLQLFILIGCKPKYTSKYKLVLEGSWDLYAMNFTHGDSSAFKKTFPNKNYASILEMDILPLRYDSTSNGQLYIGYALFNKGDKKPYNILSFYGVFVDSNRISRVYLDDIVAIEIKKHKMPEDSILYDFINNNKQIRFSKTLLDAFKQEYPDMNLRY